MQHPLYECVSKGQHNNTIGNPVNTKTVQGQGTRAAVLPACGVVCGGRLASWARPQAVRPQGPQRTAVPHNPTPPVPSCHLTLPHQPHTTHTLAPPSCSLPPAHPAPFSPHAPDDPAPHSPAPAASHAPLRRLSRHPRQPRRRHQPLRLPLSVHRHPHPLPRPAAHDGPRGQAGRLGEAPRRGDGRTAAAERRHGQRGAGGGQRGKQSTRNLSRRWGWGRAG